MWRADISEASSHPHVASTWDGNEQKLRIDDKNFIGEQIGDAFLEGFEGFDHIMAQANSVMVLPLTEGTTWTVPATDQDLSLAAEAWFSSAMASEK